jgi:hypothetical protein
VIFIPVVAIMFSRNQYFIDVASKNEDLLTEFSIRKNFKKHHVPINRYEASTINKIYLYSDDGDLVEVGWINIGRIDEFIFQNGKIISGEDKTQGVLINIIKPELPLVIRPRSYGALPLLFGSLILYGFLIYCFNKKDKNLVP